MIHFNFSHFHRPQSRTERERGEGEEKKLILVGPSDRGFRESGFSYQNGIKINMKKLKFDLLDIYMRAGKGLLEVFG